MSTTLYHDDYTAWLAQQAARRRRLRYAGTYSLLNPPPLPE